MSLLLIEAVVLAGNYVLLPIDRTGDFVKLQMLVILVVVVVLGMVRAFRRIPVSISTGLLLSMSAPAPWQRQLTPAVAASLSVSDVAVPERQLGEFVAYSMWCWTA